MASVRVEYRIQADSAAEWVEMRMFLDKNPETTKVYDDVAMVAVVTQEYTRTAEWK